MRRSALVLTIVMLPACADCPDSFELSERVLVHPGLRVELIVPDGELLVAGRERDATLEIEARGCRARAGASISVDTATGARRIRVIAPHANVRALVPAGVELGVVHGSGDVEVRAVGNTRIETRGGDVRVQQVIGTIAIEAGPGTLYVRNVIGDVDVVDGPGAVFIEDVAGHVRVRDGSGGIHLREIEGDAVIEADGSGGVDARTIGGDFVVGAKVDQLNLIRYRDVAGGVSLPE